MVGVIVFRRGSSISFLLHDSKHIQIVEYALQNAGANREYLPECAVAREGRSRCLAHPQSQQFHSRSWQNGRVVAVPEQQSVTQELGDTNALTVSVRHVMRISYSK